MPANPVTSIWGVGPNVAERLENLGIRTVTDLLLHMPRDYQDRTRRTALSDVADGDFYVVQGRITRTAENVPRSRGLHVYFEDDSGQGEMRLVHYRSAQANNLREGAWLRLYGKPAFGRTFIHPQYQVLGSEPGEPKPEFRPIYPTTAQVSSARLNAWIKQVLPQSAFFPKYEYDGYTLADAIKLIHEPNPVTHPEETNRALRRVAFEEMLALVLIDRHARQLEIERPAQPLPSSKRLGAMLLQNLGFELTAAQKRVVTEVLNDLSESTAMRRLIQGDVGSGKTVIAAFAAIRAAENGAQTAVMSPTELLAEQHFQVFSDWLEPLGIQVCLLTSRMSTRDRSRNQARVANGEAQVVVGTHALFQERTVFNNLALSVVDEQHRFGVHQRMQLVSKGLHSHQLVLTATPIPRTLALTMFGDLDISVIDELPPNRTSIATSSHSSDRREDVINAIERQLREGHQVYWVCVAIDENSENELAASKTTYETLSERFRNLGVGHVNGRMKVAEKNSVMTAFRSGEIRLLIATTVIEVGIDVPNATVMVIENAERLGLAQLHQLRGRVGRGAEQSYCLLLYRTPASAASEKRLQAMRDSTDGFKLAEIDLEMRGMGQLFGKQQSGNDPFRIADIGYFIEQHDNVLQEADRLLREDPDLAAELLATWTPQEQGYVAT